MESVYCYCTGAKRVLHSLDWYVGDRIWRWKRKKHPKAGAKALAHRQPSHTNPRMRVWQAGSREQYLMASRKVLRYRRGWMRVPDFAKVSGEPDA